MRIVADDSTRQEVFDFRTQIYRGVGKHNGNVLTKHQFDDDSLIASVRVLIREPHE